MTGSEVVMKMLERHGVEVIFGHPGGAIMPIYDALYDSKIKHVLVRHEQGGAHMADAYYRASGKVGVCFATSGPGATNLVTGLATAMMDSSAVVAITGNVPSGLIGTDAFQEADVYGITGPVTKHNYLVKDVADLPRVLAEAFHIAGTGRPGPVLIDVPKNVQLAKFEGSLDVEIDLPGYRPTVVGHAKQIRKAAEAVIAAKRPVLIVGGGGQVAPREVADLVERTGIPVITTLMGIGSYPPAATETLGMPGMHGTVTANKAISNCDLILAAGIRFDDRVTGKISRFAPNATVVHIDIDPAEIGKLVRAHVPVVGDLRDVLPRLTQELGYLDIGPWRETLQGWKATYPEKYQLDKPLVSQEVLAMLREATGGNCIVATEVGQHQMFAARLLPTTKARSFITSGGLGTMGFGLPSAIGAAIARPGETVVLVAGDGSIQMNIQELATLYKQNLPIVIAILNNGMLGMVRQWQELFHAQRYSEVYLADSNPDFAKLAGAYGIEGHNIFDRDAARPAIEAAIAAKKPVLLNFFVYEAEKVFPMVPSGAGVDEMILGDQEPADEPTEPEVAAVTK
ncbi:MAG: biosynthetic-type acetolactate synthase large subunit [Trueperaceae bacterium]|jgi:acetolactate synthase-1/2/3 large subunit|nr:biosynthetic-type acetolactate synthase large subunit [Truepera sp.]HRN19551.1 biosynthetic-type acetolactate synthase large subunit [Trueperaceae bacterium]HRQ11470.1 biosynthetic-type acetolactate synthase large subunit [Trueperaceae bacterium]